MDSERGMRISKWEPEREAGMPKETLKNPKVDDKVELVKTVPES